MLPLTSVLARRAWYDSYLTTIIGRDISEFAEIGKATAIPGCSDWWPRGATHRVWWLIWPAPLTWTGRRLATTSPTWT